MSQFLQLAALSCTALGLLSAAGVLVRGFGVRLAVAVLLEFLLAAGLLRLGDDPSAQSLATAAVIVVLRRLLTTGLGLAAPGGSPLRRA
jgi:hypothetical protein